MRFPSDHRVRSATWTQTRLLLRRLLSRQSPTARARVFAPPARRLKPIDRCAPVLVVLLLERRRVACQHEQLGPVPPQARIQWPAHDGVRVLRLPAVLGGQGGAQAVDPVVPLEVRGLDLLLAAEELVEPELALAGTLRGRRRAPDLSHDAIRSAQALV